MASTSPEPLLQKPFLEALNTRLVPAWIALVAVWQAICGAACILFALIIITPDTFQGVAGSSDRLIDTLTGFSSSSIFRWAPTITIAGSTISQTQFINAIVVVVLGAYGVLMLGQIPGLVQRQSRARLWAFALNWVGTLVSAFYMVRQMTVNRNLLLKMIDNKPTTRGIVYKVIDTIPVLGDILNDSYSIDRLRQGLEVFPIFLVFAVAAGVLFNRRVADVYRETLQQREALLAYVYISPYLLIASIFTIGLLILAFYLSFNDLDLFGDARWVGLRNYDRALDDTRFLISLSNVAWYALIVVTCQTTIALILATLMNENFIGRRVFRTLFYAPSVTSPVVICLIFLWLFSGVGFVNDLLFDKLNARPVTTSLGITVREGSPGLDWYNVPNRLGDMIYLKPFFNEKWWIALAAVLAALAMLLAVRLWMWLQTASFEMEATLLTLGVTAGSTVILTVLGYFWRDWDNFKEIVQALPLLSSISLIIGAIAMGRSKTTTHPDRATHNLILAGLGWFVPVIVLSFLAGGEKKTLAAGVVAIGWMVFALLLGMVITQAAYRGPKASVFTTAARNNTATVPAWVERMAGFGGVIVPVLLALFVLALITLAVETAPYSRVSDMPNDRFASLLARGPSVAFMTIMLQNIFTTAPTFMLMYLAALQDIPGQLYEAAQIDGATRLQRFTKITVPLLRPVTLLIVVLSTIGTFQLFDQVAILTQGAPANTTMVPVYLIFTSALGDNRRAQVGYASAMAFILGAIIFVFTFIQRRYLESGTEQQ